MTHADLMSINTVAAKLGLSVHQLRRWELMFGLEIKRGRGQQRQYRQEDLSVLERIKELVEQGWPTSQIRPQLEAEGLITPKLIGLPSPPGNPEVVMESLIGFRNFAERRFIELSKQIDELRQLVISLSFRQELPSERLSPWQPLPEEPSELIEPRPAEEILLGPTVAVVQPASVPDKPVQLQEISDQNYLTVLGQVLDQVGWSDEQADQHCLKTFSISDWTQLGRSQAERFIIYLQSLTEEPAAEDATV